MLRIRTRACFLRLLHKKVRFYLLVFIKHLAKLIEKSRHATTRKWQAPSRLMPVGAARKSAPRHDWQILLGTTLDSCRSVRRKNLRHATMAKFCWAPRSTHAGRRRRKSAPRHDWALAEHQARLMPVGGDENSRHTTTKILPSTKLDSCWSVRRRKNLRYITTRKILLSTKLDYASLCGDENVRHTTTKNFAEHEARLMLVCAATKNLRYITTGKFLPSTHLDSCQSA